MIIYLDTCCYGRPYDNTSQIKIATEAAAVMAVIETCRITGHCIIGSTAVTFEFGKIRDAEVREDIEALFDTTINAYFAATADDDVRAQALQAEGLGKMDSYHLAIAEAAGADALLTTDVDFARICAKKNLSEVRVINPLNFLPEVIK
jgi:predicted nucleic acid-binding protein